MVHLSPPLLSVYACDEELVHLSGKVSGNVLVYSLSLSISKHSQQPLPSLFS